MRRRPSNVELLAALARVFRARKVAWYVFGAQAAIVYGSARMTLDVDVTVAVSPEEDRAELLPTLERLLAQEDD